MSRSNRFTSSNNNNSKGGSNNRFSSLNDPADAKKPENKNKKDKDRESSSFSKNSNSRFDSLKEELPAPPSVETLPSPIINSNININSNYNNRSQYNSFRSATIIKKEEIKVPDLKEDDFPDLQLVAPVKKESTIVNKWTAAVKKEVKVVKEEDDEDKVYVEPGWICIRKNKKTGNTTVYKNYVYKMINAWGDSIYAKEFYGKEHPLPRHHPRRREQTVRRQADGGHSLHKRRSPCSRERWQDGYARCHWRFRVYQKRGGLYVRRHLK
jgi:hypothetical protein